MTLSLRSAQSAHGTKRANLGYLVVFPSSKRISPELDSLRHVLPLISFGSRRHHPVTRLDDSYLEACAAEPIRIPGAIQPHGALLVIDPASLRILQQSANAGRLLGLDLRAGDPLSDRLETVRLREEVLGWLSGDENSLFSLVRIGSQQLQLTGRRGPQGALLEFEQPPREGEPTLDGLYPRLRDFLDRISGAHEIDSIAREAAKEVRAITQFDRILLYNFDGNGGGTVLAEDANGVLPSYLGLRFPASDIPAQARELYRLNRIRLIPDADYEPVPIDPPLNPLDGRPLDLSQVALRSVSPVHLEYMRNMETASAMSMSIIVDGALWGLISGHSRRPRMVNPQIRTACDILAQVVSLQIGSRLKANSAAERLELKDVETQLLSKLSVAPSFQRGLVANPREWLRLVDAEGAAVVVQGNILTAGRTPTERQIRELAAWLFEAGHDVFDTHSLSSVWTGGESLSEEASGVLAVSISQIRGDYIFWFRPEVVKTVSWGGNPNKPMEAGVGRLHPRKSFDQWKELVRQQSKPWTMAEVESALGFRASIQTLVLKAAEERAELTDRLEAANKELESFSYSISHDLRAPFRHIVGFAELLSDKEKSLDEKSRHYIETIRGAAISAGRLVDDLLHFSQLGRSQLLKSTVDIAKLVNEVRHSLRTECNGRNIEWRVGKLPPGYADPAMLRQVLQNLLHNAIKYTAPRDPAIITVSGHEDANTTTYVVADNGVGFDMAYVDKLFGVFQRLHRAEEFEGTGIGLALVKRIVERHGGEISAEGEVGGGASITFTLPRPKDIRKRSS